MRRIASAPGALYYVVRDVTTEVQLEAMARTPILAAGTCFSSANRQFPVDLIGGDTNDAEAQAQAQAAVASCLALPPDGECTRQITSYRYTADAGGGSTLTGDRSADTVDRWMRAWLRRRKRSTRLHPAAPDEEGDEEEGDDEDDRRL
jgi:hypothetical protein